LILIDSGLLERDYYNRFTVHQMQRKKFLVEHYAAQWKITADGAAFGSFAEKRDAITFAVDAAYRVGPLHRLGTQVLIQRRDGTYRIVWTFGIDPYPMEYRDPPLPIFRRRTKPRATAKKAPGRKRTPTPRMS
jgi:hypothetical protein